MNQRILKLLPSINELFKNNDIPIIEVNDIFTYNKMIELLIILCDLLIQRKIKIKNRKRKNIIQKYFELIEQHAIKIGVYEKHLSIIEENKNSYSEIDKDATFVRMKENYMKNEQLKPAYNL